LKFQETDLSDLY
jgi:hypothetical protein